MSNTSKSPRRILLAAHELAKGVLPVYSQLYRLKKFTLPQLFACLVLKASLKLDYRGVAGLERFQCSYAAHREDACHSRFCSELAETLVFRFGKTALEHDILRVAKGAIRAGRGALGPANRRPPTTAVAWKCRE
jgi:hypothetical protein